MTSSNGHGPTHNGNGNGSSNGSGKNTGGYGRKNAGRAKVAPSRYAHIVGWGMKVPDTVVTNADLEAVVETTDEWIRTRTGIQERRFADEKDSVVTLGFEAARAALDRANVLPSELDLIIVATSTPEDIYPSTACKIQNMLGTIGAGAFDLSAACSGFVYAMNMAAQAIRSGSIDTALVVGSEVNSRVMDWSDRGTCILFGDGAGAVVLQGSDEPGGVMSCILGSDGSGADLLGIPTVGYATIPEGKQLHKLHMDGREVFRFATHIINESVREALSEADLKLADLALIVPHQANQRIIAAAARSLNVPESLFYSNLQRYGNTSAASIPIALCEAERDGRLKPNDNIVMVGFGGGLTWATMAIKWQSLPVKPPSGIGYRFFQGRREAEFVMAFWRTQFIKSFRRAEAFVFGSPTKHITRPARITESPDGKPQRVTDPGTLPPRPDRIEKIDKIESSNGNGSNGNGHSSNGNGNGSNGNGNGHSSNGNGNGNGHSSDASTIINNLISSNGNGNGSNGNGHSSNGNGSNGNGNGNGHSSNGNGANGNGHSSNGNVNGVHEPEKVIVSKH